MQGTKEQHTSRRRGRLALLACFGVAAGLALIGSVWAGGLTPNGTQPPLAHALLDPGVCQSCHGNFDAANNVEPYPTWAGSMMANAARDPIFWAALDVANHDLPGVGEFCLRCHVPVGWLGGRSSPPGGSADGCALLGNLDEPDNDFEGLSCHFCHRLMVNPSPPPGQQGAYYENAQVWVDDDACTTPNGSGSEPCRRGPYQGYTVGNAPPHEWAFSQYHVDADLCGNCHNVTNPVRTLIDEKGVDTGIPYPIERTFKEWQQSAYGPSSSSPEVCQDCHMPTATADPVYACIFEQINRAGELPVHRFVGGNAWIPRLLRDAYPALGRTSSYNATIAWAEELLQSAAQVEVAAPAQIPLGGEIAASVEVTNLAGHKLPTGYTEGRRMWLNVRARDGAGTVFWESGAYDGATGELAPDPQLKVYHSERGIWDYNGTGACDTATGAGDPIFHFVLNDCIAVDNRIPPLGFTGGSDPETQPVAYAYPETSPGSGVLVNYDPTSYTIPVPRGTRTPVALEVRLHYQTASRDYVEFLRDEAVDHAFPNDCIPRTTGLPGTSRGELLHAYWTTYDRSPPVEVELASASVSLGLPVFSDGFESGSFSAWSVVVP